MEYQTSTLRTGAGAIDRAEFDAGLRAHMLRVYNYLAGGLALSGAVALAILNTPLLGLFYSVQDGVITGVSLLGMIAMFAPLAMILGATFMLRNASSGAIQTFYWVFTAMFGISLSQIALVYTGESVARVFFITAAAFAGLSLWGYTTKRDLSGMGSFLIMGLIGLIIAMIVNIFLASSALQFIISGVGVLVFSGLIAFDTQRLKEEYAADYGEEVNRRGAIWGALSLYISFINLFQFLLMFLGNRE